MKFKMKKDVEVEVSREDFLEYEGVRLGGEFNMFDPNARVMTDLSRDVWLAIMSNYDELAEKYLDK